MDDSELFDDAPFWALPNDVSDSCNKTDSNIPPTEVNMPICVSCQGAKVCRCDETLNEEHTVAENGPYLTMNIWLYDNESIIIRIK